MARLPQLPASALLLAFLSLLAALSLHFHYDLPVPQAGYASDSTPQFSELRAQRYVRDLAEYPSGEPKYRILGTNALVEAENYIVAAIETIQKNASSLHQIEIFRQTGSGAHLFDFMDKKVWKKYTDINNIIVRISDGTNATKNNALLVNAHTDSTLPSPGAADDIAGVSVMLEILRVLAETPRPLTNSVVFLFNSAEESLQDASHLFITQHELAKTIQAVINLEACGNTGPSMAFQATSTEMVLALSKTPRPYASILSSEVFSSGILLSDTDFRQFEQYGNLSGVDIAIVQNSYHYHTRLDVPDNLGSGSLQHMGDNVLSLVNYFTSNETAMGNSPTTSDPLPRSNSVVYSSLFGGRAFMYFTREATSALYGMLASAVLFIFIESKRKLLVILALFSIFWSFGTSLVFANVAAFVTSALMGKSMTWFRHEYFPVLLYGPFSLLGTLGFQAFYAKALRTSSKTSTPLQRAIESSTLEHTLLTAQLFFYMFITIAGQSAGIGSSFLTGISTASCLFTLILNDYVLASCEEVHFLSYFLAQVTPIMIGGSAFVGTLDIIVPLMGRIGHQAPVDAVIASITAVLTSICLPMFIPYAHRHGMRGLFRIAVVLLFIAAAMIGWFTRPSAPIFDALHPKRLFFLHMENVTAPHLANGASSAPVSTLHVASIDGVPFSMEVLAATNGLVKAVEKLEVTPAATLDWEIIYPVDQFLVHYSLEMPPTPSHVSDWSERFTVKATNVVLHSIDRTKSFTIEVQHPSLIWPVITFEADIVSWELPAVERGKTQHHVKAVSGYGVSLFTLDLVIQLDEAEFAIALQLDQIGKGQRQPSSTLTGLRIDFAALDEAGMWPASAPFGEASLAKPGVELFRKIEKRLPDYVDALFLSAIAGVAYV